MASESDYYAMFLNGLAGLIDDAEMSGYDPDGIAHLREANEFFGQTIASDNMRRHKTRREMRTLAEVRFPPKPDIREKRGVKLLP
jgi:hypothetical protein